MDPDSPSHPTIAAHDHSAPPPGNSRLPVRFLLPVVLLLLWAFSLGQSYHYLTYRLPGTQYPYGLPGLDENGYFSFAHSLALDGDVDFRNQYNMIAARQGDDATGQVFRELAGNHRAQGRPENLFPAGSGLVSVPVLASVRALDQALSRWLQRPAISSSASVWVWLHLATQATFGLIGALGMAYLLYRITGQRGATVLTTLVTILAGPTLVYWLWLPGMSHLTGWGLSTLALILWCHTWIPERTSNPPLQGGSYQQSCTNTAILGALCGLCLGFATAARPYNLPLILLGAEPLVRAVVRSRFRPGPLPDTGFGTATPASTNPILPALVWALASGLGALLGFLPQLLVWHAQWGTYLANAQGWEPQFPPPHALQVLFSPRHGLFYWSPILALALPGLVLMVRRGGDTARIAILLAAIGLAWLFMAGSWRIWWLGVAFGMRGAVDLTTLLAIPLGCVAATVLATPHWRTAILVATLAIMINLHLSLAFRSGIIWSDGPLQWTQTLTNRRQYRGQLQVDWDMWTTWSKEFRHPLTAPAPGLLAPVK